MSQHITLPGWAADVEDLPDGGKALIYQEIAPPSGNILVFPMSPEGAEEIGNKLLGKSKPKVDIVPASALRAIPGGKAA